MPKPKKTKAERKKINATRNYRLEYDRDQAKRSHYRTVLKQANRDAGTAGNGDGKDMSHTAAGKLVQENQSTNRARNGKNGKSTKKPTKKK